MACVIHKPGKVITVDCSTGKVIEERAQAPDGSWSVSEVPGPLDANDLALVADQKVVEDDTARIEELIAWGAVGTTQAEKNELLFLLAKRAV